MGHTKGPWFGCNTLTTAEGPARQPVCEGTETLHKKDSLKDKWEIVPTWLEYGSPDYGSDCYTGPCVDFPLFGNNNLGHLPSTAAWNCRELSLELSCDKYETLLFIVYDYQNLE